MRSPEHSEVAPSGQPETPAGRPLFLTLPHRLFDNMESLTLSDLKTLIAIASFGSMDRDCWPKQQTIATRINLSRQTTNISIRKLVGLGLVEATAQYRKDGGQRENRYRVLYDGKRDPLDIVVDLDADAPPAPPLSATADTPPVSSDLTPPVSSALTATKDEHYHKNNPPSPQGGDEFEKAFDEIWEVWPEHGRKHSPGKALCLRAFEKAAQGIPLPSMISAVKAFVAQLNPKYAPSLSKWLREGKAEAWLPKTTAIAVPGGARAFSTALPVAPSEDARKCLGALQERFGETKVAAWFSDAIWDGKVIRLKSAYHAQRVTVDFGGVLREHGFTAVEGSAAA